MEWREFLKTKFYEGDKIWICDYRFKNRYVDKPIRHIKPTKVMIRSNSDLPKNKRIYYSDWHFNGLNKADEPLKSKIIAPFDNTGYRQFTGTPVHVFLTEEEAQEHYVNKSRLELKLK